MEVTVQENQEFDLDIFNVSGEPEDFQINFDEDFEAQMEVGGRRT